MDIVWTLRPQQGPGRKPSPGLHVAAHTTDAHAKPGQHTGAAPSAPHLSSVRTFTLLARPDPDSKGGVGGWGQYLPKCCPPPPGHLQVAEQGTEWMPISLPPAVAPVLSGGTLGASAGRGAPLGVATQVGSESRPSQGPESISYRLSVRVDAWFISLLAIKFLISEK